MSRRPRPCLNCGQPMPHQPADCITTLRERVAELERQVSVLRSVQARFADGWLAQERYEAAAASGGDVAAAREAINAVRVRLGVRRLPE